MAEGGGWLSKYGIPSVLASIVVFAFQQQQQTFDRLQTNVQSGYQFYSSNRTQLSSSEDADRELALLKIVGRAFPNIYCDLRDDLYQRVLAAQNADTTKSGGIDSADLELLRSSIMAHELDHPKVQPLPTNLVEAMTPHFGSQTANACPALNVPTPAQPVVAQAAPTTTTADAGATATTAASTDAPAAAAPPQGGMSSVSAPAATISRGPTARGFNLADQPRLASTASTMRVFFHVSAGGARDSASSMLWSNQARVGLAPYNYRVVRGIERVNPGDVPAQAEIRYFGPNEAQAAEQLAVYLNWQFREEGLHFRLNAIGDSFPNMPHENLEVWLPDPH